VGPGETTIPGNQNNDQRCPVRLTQAQQQLAKIPFEKGRDLLKQVRTHLIETAKPLLQALVQEITGVKVVSLYHDISTVTGEAFVILTLAEPPSFRQAKKP